MKIVMVEMSQSRHKPQAWIAVVKAKTDSYKGLFGRAAAFHPVGMKNKPRRGEMSPEGAGATAERVVGIYNGYIITVSWNTAYFTQIKDFESKWLKIQSILSYYHRIVLF